MTRFRLQLVSDDATETVFEGEADKPISIGRGKTNAVVLHDSSVSKQHATIEETADGLRIRDVGSLNGTRRGSERVAADGVLLADGDQLRLGQSVLRFGLVVAETRTAPRASKQPPLVSEKPLPFNEMFGPYGIVRPLDRAGDEVHLAVDSRNQARVALKRIPASRFGWFGLKGFLRACEAARALRHENVIAPCDSGKQGNTVYVVFPYVAGVSIERVVRDVPKDVSIELAVYVAREVSAALAYLEQDKAVGGRPEVTDRRVMLTSGGRAVLLGAGVPRMPEEGRNAVLARYLAPEEDAGQKGDIRAAIFAVGILLYEMLTQEPIDAGQKNRLRGVDGLRIEVPTSLGQTTMRAIRVRPESRYDHAEELESDLGEDLES